MTISEAPTATVQRKIKAPKMAEVVANELRRQIVKGELQTSEALPSEAELMEQFGVSRPTLREAFRVLESESLISVRRGARGGARVNAPDASIAARYAALVLEYRNATLQDVLAARTMIEPACVRQLALEHTTEDIARLRAAVEEAREAASNPSHQMSHQTSFHALLVELVGNQTMILMTSSIQQIIDIANRSAVEAADRSDKNEAALRKGFRAHEKVVDLIEAGDGGAAYRLWEKHLVEAEDYLLDANQKLTVLELMD
jgi:DNA-binding FadR family transcriptional regulator